MSDPDTDRLIGVVRQMADDLLLVEQLLKGGSIEDGVRMFIAVLKNIREWSMTPPVLIIESLLYNSPKKEPIQ